MAQQRNICRFCGEPGASREHIFATWIGRAMSPPPVPGTDVVFSHRWENPTAGIGLKTKRARGPAFFTRAFCRACNEGWMSDLEQEVQPLMAPMIVREWRVLEPVDQRLLAFWSVKTALAFQAVESATTTFAEPRDYRQLFEDRRPTARARVWVGMSPDGDDAWYRAHSVRIPSSPLGATDGFGVTIIVGHVILYVLIGRELPIEVRLRGDAAFALRELAPLGNERQIRWPPPMPLRVLHPGGLGEFVMQHARGLLAE